jgi:hypothetical protein
MYYFYILISLRPCDKLTDQFFPFDISLNLCRNDAPVYYCELKSDFDSMYQQCLDMSALIQVKAVLVAYTQENTLWQYMLFQDSAISDRHSTIQNYFHSEPIEEPGNADLLADCFYVNTSEISNYLVFWPKAKVFSEVITDKSYPHDVYPIGDIDQISDFLNSLKRTVIEEFDP